MIDPHGITFAGFPANTILLEVPINPPLPILTSITSSIRVTVGLENQPNNQDRDPLIGLTDGNAVNQFMIRDAADYANGAPPCDLLYAVEVTNAIGETVVQHQISFLFSPVTRFGACYTGHEGGYVSHGIFDQQLILTNGLTLQIQGDNANENYRFFYFLVEFLE